MLTIYGVSIILSFYRFSLLSESVNIYFEIAKCYALQLRMKLFRLQIRYTFSTKL